MQTVVNAHEAKTHLSRLLEAVERGEEFVIARAGQPVAMLSAYHPPRRKIAPPGSMEGQSWWMADDFDEAIDDLVSPSCPCSPTTKTPSIVCWWRNP
ncbi:MAG TPA: type II toxin-antitoxin system prevent-host-death family antitoxin [Candidatus Competibacter sp.]|nr:type II toxin-antitoxin system prevent-host-death family antitoxin [Candidatus Competibacteraceae bacterium]HRC73554.1 type II toxin-antitoxin system prevent-host-death family antitoxin [Candidatus Competibacter sp.]